MESFEVNVNNVSFRIISNCGEYPSFSVFNHATCHVIMKNDYGEWVAIQHRFGADNLPLFDIGEAIENYYAAMNLTRSANSCWQGKA